MCSTIETNFHKTLGVTSAISMNVPTEEEMKSTDLMVEAMKPYKVFDTSTGCKQRISALMKLDSIAKEWIEETTLKQGRAADFAKEVGGRICTFGSYRLGVHTQGSDIDSLLIAPRNISREDFFSNFADKLRHHHEVKHLKVIEDTFVPVIKMEFCEIEMDLTFARLALKSVPPKLDLQDIELLKNLDPRCVRSLNGSRVTDAILTLVPNINEKQAFKDALRMIKLWAKRRGIYSNAMGYLGGVSWAILVARTCQLYPNACAATIVLKFFTLMTSWEWPKPIMLRNLDENLLNMSVWDPRVNDSDLSHRMPIITPAYPQQNSSFNVRKSTFAIMQEEMLRGFKISTLITMYNSPIQCKWESLFEEVTFFRNYTDYVMVKVSTHIEQDLLEWKGLLESKIRFLVEKLESIPVIDIVCIYPNDMTNSINVPDYPFSSAYYLGLRFHKIDTDNSINVQLNDTIRNFLNKVVYETASKNKFSPLILINAKHYTRSELKDLIPKIEFKRKDISSKLLKQYDELFQNTSSIGKSTGPQKSELDSLDNSKNPKTEIGINKELLETKGLAENIENDSNSKDTMDISEIPNNKSENSNQNRLGIKRPRDEISNQNLDTETVKVSNSKHIKLNNDPFLLETNHFSPPELITPCDKPFNARLNSEFEDLKKTNINIKFITK